MIKNGSPTTNRQPLKAAASLLALSMLVSLGTTPLMPAWSLPQATTAQKPADKADKDKTDKADKTEKSSDKKADEKKAEPVIENVQSVTPENLVDKPHEYLNKNVKFSANFFCFASLALDYKPALRSSKNYLSFLVLRPHSHVPFSELKLAMAIPKDKDPDNQLLAQLKDGDELEVTGKVFATALDEPWVDVLKIKKIGSAPEDKKDEKKAELPPDHDQSKDSPGTPPAKKLPAKPDVVK